eukprot:TRINITY_DN5405_c0_g1_i1.p1 TRINITY_DN5405_c0_g1~~TRINITY_DN5405_c0_g1_i1.p1  ORF type:complete len:111 (+),score=26.59 TRINITY_DN5405_c0_g1_i1:56-388(+)
MRDRLALMKHEQVKVPLMDIFTKLQATVFKNVPDSERLQKDKERIKIGEELVQALIPTSGLQQSRHISRAALSELRAEVKLAFKKKNDITPSATKGNLTDSDAQLFTFCV